MFARWVHAGVFLGLFLSLPLFGDETQLVVPFDTWVSNQQQQSFGKIRQNITECGAALAAQSDHYRKHWVRDAALISLALSRYYSWMNDNWQNELSTDTRLRRRHYSQRRRLWNQLEAGSRFSLQVQNTPHPDPSIDLGAALYFPNGEPIVDEWGHPQNDGPALRALAHLELIAAHPEGGRLLRQGTPISKTDLYKMVVRDVDYVARHWRRTSWDLWEEVRGHHFYTLMVQRKALQEATALAYRQGDQDSHQRWQAELPAIEKAIAKHWSTERGYIIQTRNFSVQGTRDWRATNLDVATVLAVNHTYRQDNHFFGALDPRVLSTVVALEKLFGPMYAINRLSSLDGQRDSSSRNEVGLAIGRYEEDNWNGFSRGGTANPWFLATAAFAEYYFLAAKTLNKHPETLAEIRGTEWFGRLNCAPTVQATTRALLDKGDSYLRRIQLHATRSGDLSEQFDRDSGYQTGPLELTWSHSSFLTASLARLEAYEIHRQLRNEN